MHGRRHLQRVALILFLNAVFTAGALAAPPVPTLAQSLAPVKPPAFGIVLAVGAAQCLLPSGAEAPGPEASLEQVAGAFGRTLRTFGAVTAAAPATMTLINDRPVNPNIFDGMAPQDAMKFLVASLTPGQWRRLTSEQGLGLGDMQSGTQSSLFNAVLPHLLLVAPQNEPGGAEHDLTPLLPQARLRLRRRVELMVPEIGSDAFIPANASRDVGQMPRYKVVSPGANELKSTLYGVAVKEEVTNEPKPGDLDLESQALHAAVPLAGAKTVGDLVLRAGRLCRIELYADRRWESRPITVVGAASSVPAADLLRSLAFCLTGTYRKVGPAFVLTDDLLGAGTRRAIWAEFEANAAKLRRQALADAQSVQVAAHAQTELSLAPDSLAYSAGQQQQAQKFYAASGFFSVTQPLSRLTPEQQAAVQAVPSTTDPRGVTHAPDLSGKIIVQEVPALDLLVPALDGPIDPGLSTLLFNLFQPANAAEETASVPAPQPASARLPLPALMQPIGTRAVLAYPRAPAEVKDLVAAMKQLGLNQLWLPVTPTAASSSSASSRDDALLTQAIAATKGAGIGVYAVVDLLARKEADVSANAADLTLLGRTLPAAPASSAPEIFVSPVSPSVGEELSRTVRRLAALPGLAGQVWQATAAPGYDSRAAAPPGLAGGYTEAARLAFLRQQHADPVDLFPPDAPGQADTFLPNFDDALWENVLMQEWTRFRAGADVSLLQSLFRQAASAGPTSGFKVLVRQRGAQPLVSWYGSWDSINAPLPSFSPFSQTAFSEKVQARMQSKAIIAALPLQGPLTEAAIVNQWSGPLQQIGKNHSWDGFVLECSAP